jgi:hypothetical protein
MSLLFATVRIKLETECVMREKYRLLQVKELHCKRGPLASRWGRKVEWVGVKLLAPSTPLEWRSRTNCGKQQSRNLCGLVQGDMSLIQEGRRDHERGAKWWDTFRDGEGNNV